MTVASFRQTDTSATHGTTAACSGLSVTGGIARQCAQAGSPGSTAQSVSITAGSTLGAIAFESDANGLDALTVIAGTWVVRVNFSTVPDSHVTWDSVFVCRLNSSGVNQGTIGSATGLGLACNGVVSVNVTGSAPGFAAGDRFYVVCGIKNSDVSPHSVFWTPSELIDVAISVTIPFPWPKKKPPRRRRRTRRLRIPTALFDTPPPLVGVNRSFPVPARRQRRRRDRRRRLRREWYIPTAVPGGFAPLGVCPTFTVTEALHATALTAERLSATALAAERLSAKAGVMPCSGASL